MCPTSSICVMTSRMASKASEENMKISPITLMLTSPYDAIAVPPAISTTALIRRRVGVSSCATNSATIVTMGVNACIILTPGWWAGHRSLLLQVRHK